MKATLMDKSGYWQLEGVRISFIVGAVFNAKYPLSVLREIEGYIFLASSDESEVLYWAEKFCAYYGLELDV